MYEKNDLVAALLADNSARRSVERELDILRDQNGPFHRADKKAPTTTIRILPTRHWTRREISKAIGKIASKGGKLIAVTTPTLAPFCWASDRLTSDGVIDPFCGGGSRQAGGSRQVQVAGGRWQVVSENQQWTVCECL